MPGMSRYQKWERRARCRAGETNVSVGVFSGAGRKMTPCTCLHRPDAVAHFQHIDTRSPLALPAELGHTTNSRASEVGLGRCVRCC